MMSGDKKQKTARKKSFLTAQNLMTTIYNIILHTTCNVKDSYKLQRKTHGLARGMSTIYKEYQHHVYLFYLATEKCRKTKGFLEGLTEEKSSGHGNSISVCK